MELRIEILDRGYLRHDKNVCASLGPFHSFIYLFRVDIIHKSIVVKLIKIDVFCICVYVSANPSIPPGSSEPEGTKIRRNQYTDQHPHQSEEE